MSIYNPITPVQFALKIRQFAEDSFWVYRYDMGHNGFLKPVPRIVFYANDLASAEQWIEKQHRSQEGCVMLAD
ncbi:hypothetical protein [Oceanospirillum sediminis]|uniref:Uncharacterized protein n=1 Tax=Oceanospirillum sediminis TaxID=2760088 RepID=A0A839ITM9_9GAMM|nr:hypothetical protein [Oceanospirillum sediminis]MBB1487839.1 hypothetical protein [Oceanospirillum sediminis]